MQRAYLRSGFHSDPHAHNICSFSDVPPEILEKIWGNLEIQDFLKCRLINSHWNGVMNQILEQKVLSFYTKWNQQNTAADISSLIPSLWMQVNFKGHRTDGEVRCRVALKQLNSPKNEGNKNFTKILCPPKIGKRAGTPFPSNALRFGLRIPSVCSPRTLRIRGIDPFFKKNGDFLTTLILDGYMVTAQRFCEFFIHLPNIRFVAFQGADVFGSGGYLFDRNKCELTPPPLAHLTHLSMSSYPSYRARTEFPFIMYGEAFEWIMEAYGNQLIGLEVKGFKLQYLPKVRVPETLKNVKFGNLKQLEMDRENFRYLKWAKEADLTHIRVNLREQQASATLKLLFNLFERFSQTLVSLWLSVNIANFESDEWVSFPKVKELSIGFTMHPSEVSKLKTSILLKYPALEKLEFIHFTRFSSQMQSAVVKEEYWKVCPKLNTISMIRVRSNIPANSEDDNLRGEQWRCTVWHGI